MLKEVTKKEGLTWKIKPLEDKDGNLIRESKPFRSDNQTRDFIVCEMFGYDTSKRDKDGNIHVGNEVEFRVIKLLWSDRNKKVFDPIADSIDADGLDKDGFVIGVVIDGNAYEEGCDPFYPVDSNGEILEDSEGKPLVFNSVRFFCFNAENPTQEYLRATNNLKYVEETDIDAEYQEQEQKEKGEEAGDQKSRGRRR